MKRALFAATLLVLCVALGCNKRLGVFVGGGPGGDSPIMVVGGSMTLKATDGWKPCTTSGTGASQVTTCISQNAAINASEIHLFSVIQGTPPGHPAQVDTTGITGPWTIEISARDAAGNPGSSGNGVRICTSDASGTCGAGSGATSTSITIATFGSGIGFASPDKEDAPHDARPNEATNRIHNKGYRDQGCTPRAGQFCEHAGQIKVTLNGSTMYTCADGACRIVIGQ